MKLVLVDVERSILFLDFEYEEIFGYDGLGEGGYRSLKGVVVGCEVEELGCVFASEFALGSEVLFTLEEWRALLPGHVLDRRPLLVEGAQELGQVPPDRFEAGRRSGGHAGGLGHLGLTFGEVEFGCGISHHFQIEIPIRFVKMVEGFLGGSLLGVGFCQGNVWRCWGIGVGGLEEVLGVFMFLGFC